MFALQHRVRVFVFQVLEKEIQYLLLRQKPVDEWLLGPVVGSVALGEQMNEAVVRQVELDPCRPRPHDCPPVPSSSRR